MRGAVPQLPQYLIMTWCLTEAQDTSSFDFPLVNDALRAGVSTWCHANELQDIIGGCIRKFPD